MADRPSASASDDTDFAGTDTPRAATTEADSIANGLVKSNVAPRNPSR